MEKLSKIYKLDWDSQFFNMNVYRIDLNINELWQAQKLVEYTQKEFNAKLIYLFSPHLLPQKLFIEDLVDQKVIFHKKLDYSKPNLNLDNITEYNYPDLRPDIEQLAYLSGINSRFKDPRLPKNSFQKLYYLWIYNSIFGNLADKVFIYTLDDKILGFVTLKIKDKEGNIGLIAVDPNYRGKNIGSLLIKKVEQYLLQKNINYLTVATQADNLPASKFYIKNNFEVKEITYIYHIFD